MNCDFEANSREERSIGSRKMMPYELRPRKTNTVEDEDRAKRSLRAKHRRLSNQFESEYNRLKSSSVCEGAEQK